MVSLISWSNRTVGKDVGVKGDGFVTYRGTIDG